MEIETRYDITDFVRRRFDRDTNETILALHVMEIITQTCYAGTQVFYLCRQLKAEKVFEKPFKREGDFVWAICHSYSQRSGEMGVVKYREDELLPLEPDKLKVFKEMAEE